LHACDSSERGTMAGDLNDEARSALVEHVTREGLDREAVRRCVPGGTDRTFEAIVDRSDDGDALTRCAKEVLDDVGAARLPVRPGHAEDLQRVSRVAMEGRGEQTEVAILR